MFTKNEASIDRILRVVLGLVLIVVGFFFMSGLWGTIVGVVGFIPLITGAIGWCPLYSIFKIKTN